MAQIERKIRILLADDHSLVRRGFALILSREADLEIVGEAGDGRQAVALIESLRPDVAVLDVTMPQWNGMECARRVSKST